MTHWRFTELQTGGRAFTGPSKRKDACKKDVNTPRVTLSLPPAVGTGFSFTAPSSEQHHWAFSLQGVSQASPRWMLVMPLGKSAMRFNVSDKETNQQRSFFSLQIVPNSLACYIQLNV